MESLLDFIQVAFPVVGTIIVAVIEARAQKDRKTAEESAKRREKINLLSMKMQDANMQLTIVTANAVTGGHNNGNVETAKKAAEEASKDYAAFLREIAAHEVTK